MRDELERLSARLPLPPGWSAPELYADAIAVGGRTVRRVGVLSRGPDGREATGSAAQLEGSPLPRAWYELLERASILDGEGPRPVRDARGAPLGEVARGSADPGIDPRRRRSRSNGVALHTDWAAACERARLELLERDRVLASWLGEGEPTPTEAPAWLGEVGAHEWRAVRLDAPGDGDAVAAVVGFPVRSEVPLARGFAARAASEDAVEAAAAEAVQSLAFLWDEPVPTEPPPSAPTPLFHLDYYLCPETHGALRRWLDGGLARGASDPVARRPSELRFVDLTPAWLERPAVRVARAIDPAARELFFGELPGVEAERRVHPIP
ncbi:MAG TPA: YcaO-like family protein [Sandaracinaceae bacterium LLY-WYZ-13_1]|nr:YcaO-like family protein [Sandaracinaceae bacterium LLY-WYZ-13_1]